jgi:dTDP-4-amino-4,6-dideoxygalactose transaminase
MTRLAMLGGEPAFADGVPFVRPPLPKLDRVAALLEASWDQGILTNGPLVRRFEEEAAELLGVANVVAVSSCTTGLMLTVQAVGARGPVLLPSFTFSASAHALTWNGCATQFAECEADTLQLDVDDAANRARGIGAILATHVFGAPCSADRLDALGVELGIPVIYDAAHGFGALHRGQPVACFGAASVFSLTPTKPLVAGEGGLVATNRGDIAEHVRVGRDYGNPGDYDTQFAGLNGRMSELHAAVALASLEQLVENAALRIAIAEQYDVALRGIPGIRLQQVPDYDRSTYKDLTILVDAEAFGVSRDELRRAFVAEGVDTRCYFDPPVHRQTSYGRGAVASLPRTDAAASSVLSLPIYPDLHSDVIRRICEIVHEVHVHADEVRSHGEP